MVEADTIKALDIEEQQKLAQIEANAKETAGIPVKQPVQRVQTESVQPTPIPANKVLLTSQNLSTYSVTLPGEVALKGTLNILVNDKQGAPVQNAVVTIKDAQMRVISAYRSNLSGLVLTDKMLQPGTYYVNVNISEKTFPQFQVLMDNSSPIIFKITEV
jgi:hypothetical protein